MSNIICLMLTVFIGHSAVAQMAAATKVTWDVTIRTDVNASKGAVWKLLNDVEELPNYSNGYVTTIEEKEDEIREVIFADGSIRKETLAQIDHMHKFLVIKMVPESLPKGIEHAEIAIFTKDIDDDHSSISWNVKIEGKNAAKKALKEALTTEIEAYDKGLKTFQE